MITLPSIWLMHSLLLLETAELFKLQSRVNDGFNFLFLWAIDDLLSRSNNYYIKEHDISLAAKRRIFSSTLIKISFFILGKLFLHFCSYGFVDWIVFHAPCCLKVFSLLFLQIDDWNLFNECFSKWWVQCLDLADSIHDSLIYRCGRNDILIRFKQKVVFKQWF